VYLKRGESAIFTDTIFRIEAYSEEVNLPLISPYKGGRMISMNLKYYIWHKSSSPFEKGRQERDFPTKRGSLPAPSLS
jgi:hypothetical protein